MYMPYCIIFFRSTMFILITVDYYRLQWLLMRSFSVGNNHGQFRPKFLSWRILGKLQPRLRKNVILIKLGAEIFGICIQNGLNELSNEFFRLLCENIQKSAFFGRAIQQYLQLIENWLWNFYKLLQIFKHSNIIYSILGSHIYRRPLLQNIASISEWFPGQQFNESAIYRMFPTYSFGLDSMRVFVFIQSDSSLCIIQQP